MIMPYEYPVNWDALILLYQGTTRGFIVSKTLKMAIFQPKMAQQWSLIAKIRQSQLSCIFQSHRQGILCFFSRHRFHGKICLSILHVLKIFKKVKKKGVFGWQN